MNLQTLYNISNTTIYHKYGRFFHPRPQYQYNIDIFEIIRGNYNFTLKHCYQAKFGGAMFGVIVR